MAKNKEINERRGNNRKNVLWRKVEQVWWVGELSIQNGWALRG
jgi:hypothetical protein